MAKKAAVNHTIKPEFASVRGRPPSAETRARLAAPCCEKCRHLRIGARAGITCAKGRAELKVCADYSDASRDKPITVGGFTGRVQA